MTLMPPKRTDRIVTCIRMPKAWKELIEHESASRGLTEGQMIRHTLYHGFRCLRLAVRPDIVGRFGDYATTPREHRNRYRAKWARGYRARKRAAREQSPLPARAVDLEFVDSTGCVTTPELSSMAQSVGYVCPDGSYTAETHRYQMPVIVQAVQAAMDRGELTDARWPLFITRYQERTE